MYAKKTKVNCKICNKSLKEEYQRNRKYCRPCWSMYIATKRKIKKQEEEINKEIDIINNLNQLCQNHTQPKLYIY